MFKTDVCKLAVATADICVDYVCVFYACRKLLLKMSEALQFPNSAKLGGIALRPRVTGQREKIEQIRSRQGLLCDNSSRVKTSAACSSLALAGLRL